MKKAYQDLIRFGTLMSYKYASIDANTIKDDVRRSIQTAIANASMSEKLGIMPFIKMLKEDQAAMNINVTRDGNTVTVSQPSLDKPELASKFSDLPVQIKDYLEKYLELFPTKRNGESVDYDNLTVTLEYTVPPGEAPIAQH